MRRLFVKQWLGLSETGASRRCENETNGSAKLLRRPRGGKLNGNAW
jgi:hypothetical protein